MPHILKYIKIKPVLIPTDKNVINSYKVYTIDVPLIINVRDLHSIPENDNICQL